MATLEDIRKNVKAGKIKAVKPASGGRNPFLATPQTRTGDRLVSTRAPEGPITGGELDALYAKGSQATHTANSHLHGLRAVYEAGAKGVRS